MVVYQKLLIVIKHCRLEFERKSIPKNLLFVFTGQRIQEKGRNIAADTIIIEGQYMERLIVLDSRKKN